MAYGLQCWDTNGNMIFDSTVQTTYVLGSGSTGTETSGSLYDERLIGYDNSFWVQMTSMPNEGEMTGYSTPRFTLNNGLLTWVHQDVQVAVAMIEDRTFIYGVY